MASCSVTSDPKSCNAILDDFLKVAEPALKTVLPADVKKARELDSKETELI